jgi:FkbM family methyltransferase
MKKSKLKEISKYVLPPILIDAQRWVLKRWLPPAESPERIRFLYGDFNLECDSSHHLPQILDAVPNFGRNLADVVNSLGVKEPHVVDVGANIGDTAILLARFAPGAKVLCIEGDSRFIPYLKSNTAQISGVTVVEAILSDRSAQIQGSFVTDKGTAHVVIGSGGTWLNVQSLDDLLGAYREFASPAVIKIDTDGFEPAILRGARNVLATSKPVLFYEWHPDCYRAAGEDTIGHANFLMNLGYEGFTIFSNRGELLLHTLRPGRDTLESLAQFSHARRPVDNFHFDIAAFPTKQLSAWENLWCHYAKRKSTKPTATKCAGSLIPVQLVDHLTPFAVLTIAAQYI